MKLDFDFSNLRSPLDEKKPLDYGQPYYLSTDGYFFNYLPVGMGRVEVTLFRTSGGQVDQVVITENEMTIHKHNQIINQFEVRVQSL